MSDTEPVKVTVLCPAHFNTSTTEEFGGITIGCLTCGASGISFEEGQPPRTAEAELTGRDALVYAVGVASAAASRAWREVGYSAFLVADRAHGGARAALRAFDEKEGTTNG